MSRSRRRAGTRGKQRGWKYPMRSKYHRRASASKAK